MMNQGDGHLNQSLEELAIRLGGGAPDIFEDFVSFEEFGGIEELDAVVKTIRMHDISVA